MKKSLKLSLVMLAAALGAGGCAKQQVIKQEQMVPPTSAAKALPATTETPAVKAEATDALPAAPVTEAQAAQSMQPSAAAQTVTETSLKQSLEKVFFNFDSYTLSPEARQALTKNAELLKQRGDFKLRIEGNCDEVGSDDYNLALGERRASAAKSYLETLGVPADRLSIISYGKERPASAGHDEAARAQNRRDEFVITSN